MIRGIHCSRKALICFTPPGWPLAHGESCPSLHRLGVTQEKLGVVLVFDRFLSKGWNDRMCASQYALLPITDSKYMNPSCRAAYMSAAVAFSVESALPVGACPQAGPWLVWVV